MLNPFFAFGIPVALIILYSIFYSLKKLKNADYRQFVLTLISVFLTTFSYQVYRYGQSITTLNSLKDFKETFGYAPRLLLLPLLVGLLLTIYNFFRLFRRLQKRE